MKKIKFISEIRLTLTLSSAKLIQHVRTPGKCLGEMRDERTLV